MEYVEIFEYKKNKMAKQDRAKSIIKLAIAVVRTSSDQQLGFFAIYSYDHTYMPMHPVQNYAIVASTENCILC